MNDPPDNLDDLFARHPQLRQVDPALLREILADRIFFERLVEEGDQGLTEDERKELAAMTARVCAIARSPSPAGLDDTTASSAAPQGAERQRPSVVRRPVRRAVARSSRDVAASTPNVLATNRGWCTIATESLRSLTGLAVALGSMPLADRTAIVGALGASTEFLDETSSAAGARGCVPDLVYRYEPTGHPVCLSDDDCVFECREPLRMLVAEGTLCLTGIVAFDLRTSDHAHALDGGVCLLSCFDPEVRPTPIFAARLTVQRTSAVAKFDQVVPRGSPGLRPGFLAARCFRLVPRGEAIAAWIAE